MSASRSPEPAQSAAPWIDGGDAHGPSSLRAAPLGRCPMASLPGGGHERGMEWTHDGYTLTDDRTRADPDAVHRLLRGTYWAAARSRELVKLSIDNSLCFSVYHQGRQVGVARVLTDVGAISYLCDVVLEARHRSRGLGTWVMERILEHP